MGITQREVNDRLSQLDRPSIERTAEEVKRYEVAWLFDSFKKDRDKETLNQLLKEGDTTDLIHYVVALQKELRELETAVFEWNDVVVDDTNTVLLLMDAKHGLINDESLRMWEAINKRLKNV